MAAVYKQILSLDDMRSTEGSGNVYTVIIEDDDAYCILSNSSGGQSGRITKISGVSTSKTYSQILSTAEWNEANGGVTSSLATIYDGRIVGDYIQFSDSSTDAIWRVNRNTGEVTCYASQADILAATGQTAVSLASPFVVYGGEHYVYEGTSDSIIRTNGANNVDIFLTSAQLTAISGNSTVSGGIDFDSSGNLYWGSNDSDSLYSWDGANGSTVLDVADITAVTGGSSAGFGDIYYGQDGNVYFYETTTKSILCFDVNATSAADSLTMLFSAAELIAGDAASNSVGTFAWYDGHIAWSTISTLANIGFYVAVPEPATIVLLTIGTFGAMFRRRR